MTTPRFLISAPFAILLIPLLTCMAAAAATTPHDPEQIRVSLLTCGPGKEIYQLEGHSALRLQKPASDRQKGYDLVVNWGVFDFDTPNFAYRFVKGETDYMACAYPFHIFIEEYRHEGRRVVEQVIDLSPGQAQRLEALVGSNILPENRTYRYNYVKDNCATRPLAMLEAAGGHITLPGDGHTPDNTTFRTEMAGYHADYPWYQFGIDLALGSGLDYGISNRERTFAPIFLEKELAGATFTDSDGNTRPVVSDTVVLNDGAADNVTLGATPWPLSPVGIGVGLLVITFILSHTDIRRKRLSRWFDTLMYGVFFLAGCVVTFLVFISSHEATSPNWLLLWLNPLCIIPAACVWIKRCNRVVYCYQICNFAALILLLAGHHFFGQALNPAFPLFLLCDLMRSLTQIYIFRNGHRNEDVVIVSGHTAKTVKTQSN